jgi:hypothetical protein
LLYYKNKLQQAGMASKNKAFQQASGALAALVIRQKSKLL